VHSAGEAALAVEMDSSAAVPALANAGERRGQQCTVHWLLGLVR